MTVALFLTLLALALGGAFVAGLLGLGGAIVMIPLLLYVPPLLGVGTLGVKAVAGITMVQVFVAALSGVVAHRRHKAVSLDVAWVGGAAMAAASLAGGLLSKHVHDAFLLVVFALMVTIAGLLLLVPGAEAEAGSPEVPARYSRPRTALVAGGVGLGAGLVGAGGAFLLVPLLLVVVRIPMRVTIGSSLAITALSATGGLIGKLVTAQIPFESAAVVALGAIPGAQLGAAVSRRVTVARLKLVLGVLIGGIAAGVWWDVLTR